MSALRAIALVISCTFAFLAFIGISDFVSKTPRPEVVLVMALLSIAFAIIGKGGKS